jgi:hypothetical protein
MLRSVARNTQVDQWRIILMTSDSFCKAQECWRRHECDDYCSSRISHFYWGNQPACEDDSVDQWSRHAILWKQMLLVSEEEMDTRLAPVADDGIIHRISAGRDIPSWCPIYALWKEIWQQKRLQKAVEDIGKPQDANAAVHQVYIVSKIEGKRTTSTVLQDYTCSGVDTGVWNINSHDRKLLGCKELLPLHKHCMFLGYTRTSF